MIKRFFKHDPCANCKYAEEWDYDDNFTIYRCQLDMREDECDEEPSKYCDTEILRRENPINE